MAGLYSGLSVPRVPYSPRNTVPLCGDCGRESLAMLNSSMLNFK
jgi:hypothetical protein